jgi:hypothetical protein
VDKTGLHPILGRSSSNCWGSPSYPHERKTRLDNPPPQVKDLSVPNKKEFALDFVCRTGKVALQLP